ncbi:Myrosinase 1 [Gryllus bimaculatus]|nr:Myrosinase 1 [Gryllus bimaculatus]
MFTRNETPRANATHAFASSILNRALAHKPKLSFRRKGENIWDHMVHEHPEYIRDNATGDIADDSYHKYEEDVRLLAELGSDFYRFSISWARILPKGDLSQINQLGINYYDNLINELLDKGIEPLVTMYHWDLPQALQELGGWPNPILVDYFEDYARLLIETYGDRVRSSNAVTNAVL